MVEDQQWCIVGPMGAFVRREAENISHAVGCNNDHSSVHTAFAVCFGSFDDFIGSEEVLNVEARIRRRILAFTSRDKAKNRGGENLAEFCSEFNKAAGEERSQFFLNSGKLGWENWRRLSLRKKRNECGLALFAIHYFGLFQQCTDFQSAYPDRNSENGSCYQQGGAASTQSLILTKPVPLHHRQKFHGDGVTGARSDDRVDSTKWTHRSLARPGVVMIHPLFD